MSLPARSVLHVQRLHTVQQWIKWPFLHIFDSIGSQMIVSLHFEKPTVPRKLLTSHKMRRLFVRCFSFCQKIPWKDQNQQCVSPSFRLPLCVGLKAPSLTENSSQIQTYLSIIILNSLTALVISIRLFSAFCEYLQQHILFMMCRSQSNHWCVFFFFFFFFFFNSSALYYK